jgi:hypothetical protein
MATLPNIDNVFFEFENTDRGLYFTLFCTSDVKKEDIFPSILEEIKNNNFKDIDYQALEDALGEKVGLPVKIGPRQFDPEIDGQVLIKVAPKGNKAYIFLIPPQRGSTTFSLERVIQTLKENNIVAGIKKEEIKKAIENEIYNQAILAAEEIPPISEIETYYEIEYKFDLDINKVHLREDEKGRIDFRELNIIKRVKKGDLLAVKKPTFRKGVPGLRIDGEVIPPPKEESLLKEKIKLPAGKNTIITNDGMELRANIDGQIVLSDGKINVEEVFIIETSINYKIGNVEFPGTVIIKGSIEDGFKVKAEGDIQVHQTVGAAFLEAKGNIIINGGIVGKGKAKIVSKGNILSKFIENAHIIAHKNVLVDEEILHCNIEAGESVYALGRKGVIIGGIIRANKEVNAKVLGNQLCTTTKVEVGVLPRIRELLSRLNKEIKECRRRYQENKLNIKVLKEMMKKKELDKEKQNLLSKLISEQNMISLRLSSNQERKAYLITHLVNSKRGAINIQNIVYPGVEITIRNASLNIKSIYRYTSFVYEQGEVKPKLYQGREGEFRKMKREGR